MDGIKLSERLRFDIKFLLWRADVYGLSAPQIEARYTELQREYARLAGSPLQQRDIQRELEDWHPIVSAMAYSVDSA